MIKHTGVRKKHTGKQVQSKIELLEKSFSKDYEFSSTETGQGLKEQSGGTFHDAVLKICTHYFDLFDVMKNHSSSKPQKIQKSLTKLLQNLLLLTMKMILSFDNNDDSHPSNQNDDNNESQPNSHSYRWSSDNTKVEVVATTADVAAVATPLRVK